MFENFYNLEQNNETEWFNNFLFMRVFNPLATCWTIVMFLEEWKFFFKLTKSLINLGAQGIQFLDLLPYWIFIRNRMIGINNSKGSITLSGGCWNVDWSCFVNESQRRNLNLVNNAPRWSFWIPLRWPLNWVF